jgi:hypothetical protein
MATQTPPRIVVELAPHSLQFALVGANGRLEGHGECGLDAAAVTAGLEALSPGLKPAGVQVVLVPPASVVLRAGAEEATAVRTPKGLITHLENTPNAPAAPLKVTAIDASNGLPVTAVGSSPWVMTAASASVIDEAKAKLVSLGLPVGGLRLALPLHIGAVVTALQDMPESTRVLVWQIGENDALLACVSATGCEAAGASSMGFAQIFEAVQAGLGLKFRAAASKLFFNAGYDFTETAGPIAERIAAVLRPEMQAAGCKPTSLHVAGLPVAQSWLAKAVASALEVPLLSPDMTAFCTQCGLSGPAVNGELPPAALGLLLQAAPGGTGGPQAWRADWLDANAVAPAPAPAAAPAPAVAKPVPPVSKPEKPAAAPAPEPVAVKPLIGAAPVPQKAAEMKPAAVATAPAPVKAVPVAQPKPVPVAEAPAPKLAPAPVIKAEPVAQPEVVELPAPEEQPAVAAKKKPVALFAAIGAVVVLGGAGAFFMMGKSAPAETKAPVAAQLSPEDIRMREEENARMLADELKTPRSFRNDRYSFEVSDRGFLRKLVGVGNRTIIDEFGWLELQGMFTGSTRTFYAGTISDNDYRPEITKTVRDGKVVFEIKGTHPRFTMETLVTCLPSSMRVETVFKPINMEDPRGPISGVYMVKMNRQSLSLGQKADIAPGVVNYATQVGPFSLKFNGDSWGPAGEEGKQTVSVGSNLVFFYFAGGTDPKNNVLRMELTLP